MIASSADLTYFIEAAYTLNLSRASERLGISQPSLSAAIKRLENAIGAELFIRQKRGVTLTQAGKQLLAHSKQLKQYWDEVKSQALASHHEVQGHFVIGCHPSIALHDLSGFLPPLLLKHPKLEVKFEHAISRKITENVINLSIDVGVVVNPVRHPDLIVHKLADDEVTFYKAKTVKNNNVNVHGDAAVLICDAELSQVQTLLKKAQKSGIKFSRVVTSSNLEVIASLTAQGSGIGILPGSVAGSLYAKDLQQIPKMPVYHDEICLIYRHENRDIKAMRAIMDAIKRAYQ